MPFRQDLRLYSPWARSITGPETLTLRVHDARGWKVDMRHFASDSAESYAVGTVDVARWEQYSLGDTLPFQAMWYTVPPASSSPQDRHPERELSVVISGSASVEASGQITDVAAGSAFLLD